MAGQCLTVAGDEPAESSQWPNLARKARLKSRPLKLLKDKIFVLRCFRGQRELDGRSRGWVCNPVGFADQADDVAEAGKQGSEASSSSPEDVYLSCTTFNVLAPIYKRINAEGMRESQDRESWIARNQKIIDMLLKKNSSIICLQEFWLSNEELVQLYESQLGAAGYELHKLERTNNRGDGLLTAIRKDRLQVVDSRDMLLNDYGDRVAQLFRLRATMPMKMKDSSDAGSDASEGEESAPVELLLVNTHLLFPHNSNTSIVRLRQAYKILEYVESYKRETKLPPMPILLCGDWNGSKRGQVYKFLRSQGFISSYDNAHDVPEDDSSKWVSHRNHRGNICGVDFIWLLNPSNQSKPLAADWKAAIFDMVKAKLVEAGLKGREAFRFFKTKGEDEGRSESGDDVVTLQAFQDAMEQLGFTGTDSVSLSPLEVQELARCADIDGNGVIDYDEFKRFLSIQSVDQNNQSYDKMKGKTAGAVGLDMRFPTSPQLRCPGEAGSPPAQLSQSARGSQYGREPPSLTVDHWVPVHLSEDLQNTARKLEEVYKAASAVSVSQRMDKIEDEKARRHQSLHGKKKGPQGEVELTVKDAHLFPPEVETGKWPENYSLSDHAPLTTIFAPLRRPSALASSQGT
eukprot:TRINITY_DN1355_c0_g2_i2.p1 TRINITY_DN1355_c0_g2~~TRINITY_DN1355_c0_g2_i2.p1  ORF type:complete len:673 (-),score=149.09 TRINITY_DN1355_c0_g2_i2:84-1973(-)